MNYKHGEIHTRLYHIWGNIKQRLFNSKVKEYKYYGGRGITICPEWLEFIPFRDWSISNGYKENFVIDRINNDGNYEPNNCRWLTVEENNRNKTNTITMEIANEIRYLYKTENFTQQELAIKYNVCVATINNIINNKIWKRGFNADPCGYK